MQTEGSGSSAARYFYMVTFEVAPEDEAVFNEVYDTEHIPDLLGVQRVMGVLRLRDAEPNAAGRLVYSALYLLARPDVPGTPQWKAASEIGRWAPLVRPRLKSRHQRLGSIVSFQRFQDCA